MNKQKERLFGKALLNRDINEKFLEILKHFCFQSNISADEPCFENAVKDFKKELADIIEDVPVEYDDLEESEKEEIFYRYCDDADLSDESIVDKAVWMVERANYAVIKTNGSLQEQYKVEHFIENLRTDPFSWSDIA